MVPFLFARLVWLVRFNSDDWDHRTNPAADRVAMGAAVAANLLAVALAAAMMAGLATLGVLTVRIFGG